MAGMYIDVMLCLDSIAALGAMTQAACAAE
jgi:hypothetical protein